MDANWQACLKAIRLEEGGSDDDADDPGGRTSRGITQREYTAYRLHKGLPAKDVWQASEDEIDDIYRISYWEPWCPKMPAGIDLVFFDMGVNAGPYRATKILQRVLGVTPDGHIGIVTMGAIATCEVRAVIHEFSDERVAFYRTRSRFWKFGKGWLKRVARIEDKALKMIGG